MMLANGCAHRLPSKPAARAFDFSTDRLAYANETVWHYENGRAVEVAKNGAKAGDQAYATRCFVVTRCVTQFWKFASFDPKSPPLSDRDLALRIRMLAKIDVWKDPFPASKRVVFPGYRNLFELSRDQPLILQKNLGQGWPIFVRPGNSPMVFPPSRSHQERTFLELKKSLALNYPVIIWMVTFPDLSLNHSVLVYDSHETKTKTVFSVYDPNDIKKPKNLEYDPAKRTFSFQRTFYFIGGPVDVRTIYWSPMQ